MREPYQELNPEIRARAITVLQGWAARQRDRRRPFLEVIDGSTITPLDLLLEPPPINATEPSYRERLEFVSELRITMRGTELLRAVRVLSPTAKLRAWPHVLNLVAVSAMHDVDDVAALLDELERPAEIEGPAEASAT